MVLRIEVPREDGTDDPAHVETGQKTRYRNFTLIVILIALFLVLIVISMLSKDWYVADSMGAEWLPDGMWSTVHFGLMGRDWHLGNSSDPTIMQSGYEGIVQDYSFIDVARNFFYLMVVVLLLTCVFIYLVGRLEYGLEEGESRWSYFLPSIVGTVIIVLFVGGLLYFYVAFEDALRDDVGEDIDWSTSGYGWPMWVAVLSIFLLLPAISVSYSSAWHSMESGQVDGKDV